MRFNLGALKLTDAAVKQAIHNRDVIAKSLAVGIDADPGDVMYTARKTPTVFTGEHTARFEVD